MTWRAQGGEDAIAIAALPTAPRYAFLGVRACDLAAIAIQDRVLVNTAFPDRDHAARRESAFLSRSTAPPLRRRASAPRWAPVPGRPGHDLALTELLDGGRIGYLVEIGSERGAASPRGSPRPRRSADREAAAAVWTAAAAAISKTIPADGIGDILVRNLESRWDTVAAWCLGCANYRWCAPPASVSTSAKPGASPRTTASSTGRGRRVSPSTTPSSMAARCGGPPGRGTADG